MGLFSHDVDLAYDTDELEQCANEFHQEAQDIRDVLTKMDQCIQTLVGEGWTTQAGKAFEAITENDWKDNMEKYVAILETMDSALSESCKVYDDLTKNYIEKLSIN